MNAGLPCTCIIIVICYALKTSVTQLCQNYNYDNKATVYIFVTYHLLKHILSSFMERVFQSHAN